MKFTVTIPTYNRYDNFLSSTIDELLKYDSIERIVLVDDDSFDYHKHNNNLNIFFLVRLTP